MAQRVMAATLTRGEDQMGIVHRLMETSTGAMAFYLGIGVVILVAGWVADTVLAMGKQQS
jgi:hypothetical protein